MSFPAPLLDNSVWLRYVLEPAARALVLAGAAWLLLLIFRVREVSLRLAAWTTILYAALAMPFLTRVVPTVPLPVLSAESAQSPAVNAILPKAVASVPSAGIAVLHSAAARENGVLAQTISDRAMNWAANAWAAISWPLVAIAVYLLVMAFFLARFIFGLISSWRLRRASAPIADENLQAMLTRESRKAGLKSPPQLADSTALSVPATLGLLRPVVLLPAEWDLWSESETGAVLAHELSHVARRDGLTRALSRLHRALFWFSPLSWLLDRTLVELAEQASDDAALRSGADRVGYAEVLLHFFRALKAARGRVRWEGVSMAHGSRAARRVERILASAPLSRNAGLAPLAALAIAATPLICLTAAVQPAHVSTLPTLAAAAPPPPPLAALASQVVPLSPSASRVQASSPPAPPVSVERAQVRNPSSSARCPAAFAVVDAGDVVGGYGSVADLNHAWDLSLQVPGSFVWFRDHGRGYIVRDKAVVTAILDAMAPLQTVEQKEAALNWEENRLARDQFELNVRRMAQGLPAPDPSPYLRQVESQLRDLESTRSLNQLARAQAQFALSQWKAMRRHMDRMEVAAAENLEAVNREQAVLDVERKVLGCQQAHLDRQQAQLARRVLGLTRSIADRSLQQGLAIPL
jgi:beta-lactamase regulating signal transducer with metallopeptidase domain